MEWRQIQGTQHTINMTADMQKRLIQFAIHTLNVLGSDRDWNSDTINAIYYGAAELKLGTSDDNGFFKSLVTKSADDTFNTTAESLLSYSQAAQRLGVSRETIYRYQCAGKLPAIRLSSKTVRFRVSDLERLLAGAEVTLMQEKLNNHMNS
jgi:excisionase family DNA binding protein